MGRPKSTRVCSLPECGGKHYGKGYCGKHYQRAVKHGDTETVLCRQPVPLAQRLSELIEIVGDCWLWTETQLDNAGYGRVSIGGKTREAYRAVYEELVGPVPEGFVLDHKCHVRRCVNPGHLQPVTRKQNMENRKGANGNSQSGVRGVFFHKGLQKYQAKVYSDGVAHHVGTFKFIEDAEAAVIAKRNELYSNNLVDRGISIGI